MSRVAIPEDPLASLQLRLYWRNARAEVTVQTGQDSFSKQQWQRSGEVYILTPISGPGFPCVLLTILTPKKVLELVLGAGKYTCKHHTEFVTDTLQPHSGLAPGSDLNKVD